MNYKNYTKIIDKYGLGDKKRILNKIRKETEILEIGCSSGYVTKVLTEELDCKVDCVEIDKEAAALASRYARDLYVGSVEDNALLKKIIHKYDFILFLDVLEHLVDPMGTLKNIKRYLKPDGAVLAMIPNIAHWKMRLNLLLGKFDYEEDGIMDKTHLRFFTHKTCRELFHEAGFSIKEDEVSVGVITFSFKGFLKSLMMGLLPNFFARHFIIVAVPKN